MSKSSLIFNFYLTGFGVLVSSLGYVLTLESHYMISNTLFLCTALLIKSMYDREKAREDVDEEDLEDE